MSGQIYELFSGVSEGFFDFHTAEEKNTIMSDLGLSLMYDTVFSRRTFLHADKNPEYSMNIICMGAEGDP